MKIDRVARRALVRIKILVAKGFYRYTVSADDGRREHGIADEDVRDIVGSATTIVRQSNDVWRIVGVDIADRRVRLVIELTPGEVVLISVHLFERDNQ